MGHVQPPYLSWIDEQCEGAICGDTLLHMMPQGHGKVGLWWAKLVLRWVVAGGVKL